MAWGSQEAWLRPRSYHKVRNKILVVSSLKRPLLRFVSPTSEQVVPPDIPDEVSNEWAEMPDVQGDIFHFTEVEDEVVEGDLDNIILDPAVVHGVDQGEHLEDEDAARDDAAAMGLHDADTDEEGLMGIEGGQVGEGLGGAVGGQGDLPMEPPHPAVDPQHEGWLYWVGWLASRFVYRFQELNLGEPTSLYTTSARSGQAPPLWINAISQGGLTVPSESFLAMIKRFEVIFKSIHGEELSYEKWAIDRVTNRIRDLYPDDPLPIIKAYAKGRFYLRLRYLNFCRREMISQERAKKKQAKKANQAELQGLIPPNPQQAPQASAQASPTQPGPSRSVANASTSADRRNLRKNKENASSKGGGKR